MYGTEHEWIISKHLCIECNKRLGNELDGILINASPVGFVWNQLKNEWGKQTKDQQSTFYKSQKYHGIHPVRLFFTDPIYDDLIVMHEQIPATSDTAGASADWIAALFPQIILIQHPKEQMLEEAISENCEKFNTPDSGEEIITKDYVHNKVYYNFGNTSIFPPKTTEAILKKEKQRDKFSSQFLKKGEYVQCSMWVICPREHSLHSACTPFFESVKAERKTIIEQEKFSEPKEFIRAIKPVIDPKASPYTYRAIAKIAFHCFLFHHPEFSGHESMFNDIREFIYRGKKRPDKFVAEWRNPKSENLIWNSNGHFHGIAFFRQGGDIGCIIDLFTGLLDSPFTYQVNLAGNPQNTNPRRSSDHYIPFYMHPKSQRKKRILLTDSVGIIQEPSWYDGVIRLP